MTSIEQKVAAWNAKSAQQPGQWVRVFKVNPDGSVTVCDMDRRDAPSEFQVAEQG